MTPIQKQTLIDGYHNLMTSSNQGDYERASFFKKVRDVLPDRSEFVLFCTEALEQAGSTAAKHWSMAKAIETCGERVIWTAIGWAGMRLYDQVKQEDNRQKIHSHILARVEKGQAMKKSEWLGILKKIAPDVVAVNTRTSKRTTPDDVAKTRDLLAKLVQRLVAQAPILLTTLTPKEKLAAGLGAKAQKVAS